MVVEEDAKHVLLELVGSCVRRARLHLTETEGYHLALNPFLSQIDHISRTRNTPGFSLKPDFEFGINMRMLFFHLVEDFNGTTRLQALPAEAYPRLLGHFEYLFRQLKSLQFVFKGFRKLPFLRVDPGYVTLN
jgi:hypothetical protein